MPDEIPNQHLRSAIQFAVAIAEAGQRLRPPIPFPPELRPYLKQPRVPATALGRLRRAIEADGTFRARLAAGAVPELVDDIGREWLRRDEGWEERATALVRAADEASEQADAAAALRRAESDGRRPNRSPCARRAELVQQQIRLAEVDARIAAERERVTAATAELEAARREAGEAKLAARHANDRADAARSRLAAVEAERDDARRAAGEAAARRDALLAERAERAGVDVSATQVAELHDLARAARTLAERLNGLVTPETATRAPVALPGGVARDSQRATEHLLRVPGARIVVDGYNVAKLGWPDEPLPAQRSRLLDIVDDVVRRYSTDVTVVFDGADVVGSHTRQRHFAHIRYSPAGVSADDEIRVEVAGTPVDRAVVVVTNDQAIRRDVAAAGANLISSDAFLATARR